MHSKSVPSCCSARSWQPAVTGGVTGIHLPFPAPGRVRLGLDFEPAACGAAEWGCRSVFLQALRFIVPPREYRRPYQEQADRMVPGSDTSSAGWAIDRSPRTTPDAQGNTEPARRPFFGWSQIPSRRLWEGHRWAE